MLGFATVFPSRTGYVAPFVSFQCGTKSIHGQNMSDRVTYPVTRTVLKSQKTFNHNLHFA